MAQNPAYLALFDSGELARRAEKAIRQLASCAICARRCGADRLHGGKPEGYCRTGRYAQVASFGPHHGEEDCLRGCGGSGTIFFSRCSLGCAFCQNSDISHHRRIMQFIAREISTETFVNIMPQYRPTGLAARHPSINRPTTVAEYRQALAIAREEGLHRLAD